MAISQTKFLSLKPYFVQPLRNRNVCCCLSHVDTSLLLDSLNAIRKDNRVHGQHCECHCVVCGDHDDEDECTSCTARELTYSGLTVFWQSCVCPMEIGEIWHKRDCLLGTCAMCGVTRMLPTCPAEEFGDQIVKWRCYGDVVVGVNEHTGEEKKRIREQYNETTCADFFKYFKPKLQAFIRHNYVVRWQDC